MSLAMLLLTTPRAEVPKASTVRSTIKAAMFGAKMQEILPITYPLVQRRIIHL